MFHNPMTEGKRSQKKLTTNERNNKNKGMINQNIERKRNLLDVFAGMSVEQLKKEL